MNFSQLVNALLEDCRLSLDMFLPEIVVVAAIVGLLLVRLFGLDRRLPGSVVAVIGTLAALVFAAMQFTEFKDGFVDGTITPVSMFTGLLVYDPFTVFFRLFLLLFVLFVIYLTIISGIPDQEDAPDFYVLLLGSTLGMMLMASANHLLMVFLAVEMTSVPSYAMVGFLKGRKASSEAALKYVVYGAGAAGVMLYGISLLAGLLGTAHLPSMAQALAEFGAHHSGFADPAVRTLALAILMVLVGVAFKLSIFPFHFWCPDAFEGASAEVGGFLSVASKGAAFALLVRVCLALAGQAAWGEGALSSLLANVGVGLGAVTATFGNLTAYAQTNIKRMLAYSTIAHAGYMLMAVASLMVVINGPLEATGVSVRRVAAEYAVQGLLYYLVVYFFMNLGAFAVVALIRNAIYSEEIDDYSGLIRQSPFLAICMLVCLFSLIGLPPMGGFVGKLMVFYSLVEAARFQPFMWVILVAGGVNTVFSLFYYMRVVKVMFLGALPERDRAVNVSLRSDAGWYMLLVSTPVFLLMIFVEPVSRVASEVARTLFH
jgi:NADH-quinone oxidoreductase subunit N